MAYQKTYNALVLLLLLFFFFGCKKLSKEYTTARWEIINPVTNTPYVGIPVRLILADYRGNSPKYETIWEGKTNSQGIAEYKFKGYTNPSFGYMEQATLASLGTIGFDYSIIRRPYAGSRPLDELNELRYEIVPYVDIVSHIKNFNCQGPGDIMRFRQKALFTGSGNWSIWTPQHVLHEGCVNNLSDVVSVKSDLYISEIEVTRQNGSVEHFMDTSYIKGQYIVDTVKVYY